MNPLILANAPNGASKTKADHPTLPMTATELARAAAESADAGAAMIHIHVRDREGRHLLDAAAYREATDAIRTEVGNRLVVQVTSEAGGRYQPAEQMAVIRATEPEAVSLALRELLPDEASESAAAGFFAWLRRERVLVQIILYSAEEVTSYDALKRRGILGEGCDFPLFVLGRYVAGQVSTPSQLLPFLTTADKAGVIALNGPTNGVQPDAAPKTQPEAQPWAMCAFGQHENACAMVAAGLAGHVRVGFENNLRLPNGAIAARNADLVRTAADGAALLGRPLASADTAREIMRGR